MQGRQDETFVEDEDGASAPFLIQLLQEIEQNKIQLEKTKQERQDKEKLILLENNQIKLIKLQINLTINNVAEELQLKLKVHQRKIQEYAKEGWQLKIKEENLQALIERI